MENYLPLCVVVLAAGKGTRMKSTRAKVLHEVFYRPMLHHVLDSVKPLDPLKTVVIVGHQMEAVKNILTGYEVVFCEQKEQGGTGHAVLSAEPIFSGFSGDIMILCGDSPLLQPLHLQQMLDSHRASAAKLTILTTVLEDPTNYGRIISDGAGAVQAVVEEKDASPEQRAIEEINGGIYIGQADFLFDALSRVTTDNAQQEMYLTDIVAIAVNDGIAVHKFEHPHPSHVLGVNSKVELALAHAEIRARRNSELMAGGVTMLDPLTTTVGSDVSVGSGCLLGGQVTILGSGSIGDNCRIEPGAYLNNCIIENDVQIGANSVISGQRLAAGTVVAPLTLLTAGSD